MRALRVIEGGQGRPSLPPGLLRELYERHAPMIYARCRYLLRDDEEAKDALQEVFAKVLRALDEFRGAASPSTWLQRIATNHCLNVLRGRRAVLSREQPEIRIHPVEPPERKELVRALLARAPQEAQEVAVLYWVDELTQAEIAEVTGRSLPTVRKRLREFLSIARGTLRAALPDLDLPEGDEL